MSVWGVREGFLSDRWNPSLATCTWYILVSFIGQPLACFYESSHFYLVWLLCYILGNPRYTQHDYSKLQCWLICLARKHCWGIVPWMIYMYITKSQLIVIAVYIMLCRRLACSRKSSHQEKTFHPCYWSWVRGGQKTWTIWECHTGWPLAYSGSCVCM